MAGGSITIGPAHLDRLVAMEAQVHYGEPPPPGRRPFVVVERGSPVLLSAPHGCRVYRSGQGWHQEEEFTAAMALLLAELCRVSVIATLWRTDDSDPNHTEESQSPYKQALRHVVRAEGTRVLIDLHGASPRSSRMAPSQLVDLGLGKYNRSLSPASQAALVEALERSLGRGAGDRGGQTGFPAAGAQRIRAFAHRTLGIEAVQVEMKPDARVVRRRVDASAYDQPVAVGGGPLAAPAETVTGMLQALADFIAFILS